jgi:hypothetical protein
MHTTSQRDRLAPERSRVSEPRWLLLIHRIPPKPGYLRVKVWRRLQGVGAIPIKNSVYALPRSDQAREDLEWIAQEIAKCGGEATVCEARLLAGVSDPEVESMFTEAREADYKRLAEDAKGVLSCLPEHADGESQENPAAEADLERFRRRLGRLAQIDFFSAPGRAEAENAIQRIERRLAPPLPKPAAAPALDMAAYRGRTWVTRRGIHVDRIASAWLIRRFIDPAASFKYVTEKSYAHEAGELRFDMFDGEFTHEGDLCSFETLLRRFGLPDPALVAIGEIIHDVDLKESKFARPETAGLERLIDGIGAPLREDDERLARGSAVLDDLYESFKRFA